LSAGSHAGASSRLLATASSKEGLRAAEEEAVQEAQRCRLISQRTVLEAELVEKQAVHEQSELQLRRAQALLQKERDECVRLQEDLRCAIEGYAGVSGDIEAFQEHLVDLERTRCGVTSSIQTAQALEGGLQAQLHQARNEQVRARAVEEAAARKSNKLEVALARVTEIATALATDMRSQAHQLSARITASSPHLVSNTDSVPPTMVAAPREVQNAERHLDSPRAVQRASPSLSSNSPAPTTQAANAIWLKSEVAGRLTLSPDDAMQRSPLFDANGKENISPRVRGRRRRASGSEAPCLAVDSGIPELAQGARDRSPPIHAPQMVATSAAKRKRQVTNAEVVHVGRSRLLTSNIEDLCSPER